MPEQLTKHPDVTLGLLKDLGAQCGVGAPQNILKSCPRERFCALPTGEICVYGMEDIPGMTQISMPELASVVCPQCPRQDYAMMSGPGGLLMAALFIAGLALGKLGKISRRRRSDR
jgi:hypothetical protein